MSERSAEERLHGRRERGELQQRLSGWLDTPLSVLGLLMLGLLVLELTVPLSPAWATRVAQAQTAIWVIFAAAFAVEFVLAPSKLRYFKNNWLTALSVVLPALRSVRLLRAARALRGLSLVRIVTTLNRGSKVLGHLAHRGQFGYVLLLTLVVTITAAAAVYYFERTEPGASIRTVGDALWWAASIITTISSPLEAVTLEGRVVALLLRIFALAVSGYLTAVVAVYLLGGMARPIGDTEERTNDFRQLHREIQRLERLIERRLPHGQAGGEATGAVHQDRRKYVKSSAVDRGDRS